MKKLFVFYEGWGEKWHLGTLADNGRELLFEYSPQAMAQGLELSPRHLKLQANAFGNFPDYLDGLPGLIADALPDGWGRLLMDKQFRRAGINPASISVLDRLAFIGDRAMGALTFEPASESHIELEDWSLRTLANEVKNIVSGKESDALKQLAVIGGSPHGARPKALLNYETKTGALSSAPIAAGSPWLFKFPAQGEHKEVCAIEDLYAKLARDCGIEMPRTRYFDLGASMSAFGIERFDRRDGMRIPTHTLAGLLHANFRIPSVDYTTLLRATRFLSKDEREVRKAYLRCVFNVILHNRDDHAKNVSYLLTRDRQWQFAPGYDLTFSSGPRGEHQMDICGEGMHPGKDHLLQLARESEIDRDYAVKTMAKIKSVAKKFAAEAGTLSIRKSTIKNMSAAIGENLTRMK